MAEVGEGWRSDETAHRAGSDLVDLLEVRIRELVDRHRNARKTIEELRDQLRDRDRQIQELTRRMGAADRTRGEVRLRIERLITRIDQLDQTNGERPAGGPGPGRPRDTAAE